MGLRRQVELAWSKITGKPSVFPPETHGHARADITDFPANMPPTAHAASHTSAGADKIVPADIGAAQTSHAHTKGNITDFAHTHAAGDLPSATTSAPGVVQLSSSTSSTSTVLAATASAVKAAYDKGNHGHPYAADTHSHNSITWVQPGDTVLLSSTGPKIVTTEEFTTVKKFQILRPGRYRVTGTLKASSAAYASQVRLYAPLGLSGRGAVSSTFSTQSTTPVAFTLNMTKDVLPLAIIEVQICHENNLAATIESVYLKYADASDFAPVVVI
ncbi:MAG: Phage tail fiber repeat protein [bacterium ADurb.Bin429]|nr:MAG: Phage tail fiber repeat protein [bacterium ADurb.Bin429]